METFEVLKRSDLFRTLTDDELGIVEQVSTPQTFDTGAVICKQGRTEEEIYVIEEGLVGIILEVGQMAQRQVQAASNFESFGWSGMIEPYVRTATVKALESSKVVSINGRSLLDLCSTHPDMGYKISKAVAKVVADRLRQAYVQLLGVTIQQ